MKITFPECQIELTTNEAITMYDYFHIKDSGVQLLEEINRYRELVELVDERPKNTYNKPQEEEGLKSDDFRPAENEAVEERSIEEFFKPEPEEEEWENTVEELENLINGAVEEKPVKKPKAKNDHSRTPKPVDVLTKYGWKTFESQEKAAKYLKAAPSHIQKALKTNNICKGFLVRYSNPELNACLAEIEARNKEPYQPSRKI